MKLFVLPTDTLYGIGCRLNDSEGLNKIYELKKRDNNKLLPILCGDVEQVKKLAVIKNEKDLIEKYWPGSLTIIFDKINSLEISTLENYDSIAIRIPNNKKTQELLLKEGPMFVTSANISGEANITNIIDIKNIFGDSVDVYIEDDSSISNEQSTIVDCRKNFKVIREGKIKFI